MKRSLEESQELPNKNPKNDDSDRFSLESIQSFQKEALWRQLTEYKNALQLEQKRSSHLMTQNQTTINGFALLLKVFEQISIVSEDVKVALGEFENILRAEASPDAFVGLMNRLLSPSQLDNAKLTSDLISEKESALELKEQIHVLQTELQLLDRKYLRNLLELEKLRQIHPVSQVIESKIVTEDTGIIEDVQVGAINTLRVELEELRLLSDSRLEEIRRIESERHFYKSSFEVAEERLKRIPSGLEKDMKTYEQLYNQYQHLKEEFASRMASSDALNRHIGESNSRRSQMISSLEQELSQRRYALKDFADGLENDAVRLRKDRDQMRTLYETCNMQVSSLSKQVTNLEAVNDQLSRKLETSSEKLKSLVMEHQEAPLLAEIEAISEAFDELQRQNCSLLKQLSDKDELIAKSTNEKLKAEFSSGQAQRDADLSKQKSQKLEIDSMKAAEFAESELKKIREVNEQLEKNYLAKSTECDGLRWKLSDLERQFTELKVSYEILHARFGESNLIERLRQFEQILSENKRLEEALRVALSKLDAYVNSTGAVLSREVQDELAIYKKLMKCNSCHIREKNVVLAKCYHVFCKECIDTRIETRQRKCPNCGESFGANDVKPLYL